MTTVNNNKTGDHLHYRCDPKHAVIYAYARSRGDEETWNYTQRYQKLFRETAVIFQCGHFITTRTQDEGLIAMLDAQLALVA